MLSTGINFCGTPPLGRVFRVDGTKVVGIALILEGKNAGSIGLGPTHSFALMFGAGRITETELTLTCYVIALDVNFCSTPKNLWSVRAVTSTFVERLFIDH
jgi:hypothetical protein